MWNELGRIVYALNNPPAPAGRIVEVPNPFEQHLQTWLPILRGYIDKIPELARELSEAKLRNWLWENYEIGPDRDLYIEQLVKLLKQHLTTAGKNSRQSDDDAAFFSAEKAKARAAAELNRWWVEEGKPQRLRIRTLLQQFSERLKSADHASRAESFLELLDGLRREEWDYRIDEMQADTAYERRARGLYVLAAKQDRDGLYADVAEIALLPEATQSEIWRHVHQYTTHILEPSELLFFGTRFDGARESNPQTSPQALILECARFRDDLALGALSEDHRWALAHAPEKLTHFWRSMEAISTEEHRIPIPDRPDVLKADNQDYRRRLIVAQLRNQPLHPLISLVDVQNATNAVINWCAQWIKQGEKPFEWDRAALLQELEEVRYRSPLQVCFENQGFIKEVGIWLNAMRVATDPDPSVALIDWLCTRYLGTTPRDWLDESGYGILGILQRAANESKQKVSNAIDAKQTEDRAKAVSSPNHFRNYVRAAYSAGDILPDANIPDDEINNWRGIVHDLWEMARNVQGVEEKPPPLPPIDSEASAFSAMDQLLNWIGRFCKPDDGTRNRMSPGQTIESDQNEEGPSSVLVLGKDTGEGLDRLQRIASKLHELGYNTFIIKQQPDKAGESIVQKVMRYALLSRFVVVENTDASGHLYEVPHVTKAAECVTVVLQEEGKGATWMFEDAYAKHKHWQKITYEGEGLESAVTRAVDWAEKFVREFAAYQMAHLPWLSKKP